MKREGLVAGRNPTLCNIKIVEMSYHNAYNYVPHPTMYCHNLNIDFMTMLAKVPNIEDDDEVEPINYDIMVHMFYNKAV